MHTNPMVNTEAAGDLCYGASALESVIFAASQEGDTLQQCGIYLRTGQQRHFCFAGIADRRCAISTLDYIVQSFNQVSAQLKE